MSCHDMVWRTISSLLLVLLLFGCDYGERNKTPLAQGDTAVTARGIPVMIDVLANDSDPDGDPVILVAWTQGDHGEVTRDGDGTLTYTPDEGFDGSDRFTYTIDDDHGGQATGMVTITVLPHPGVAAGGTLNMIRDVSPAGVSQAAAWGLNDAGQISASGASVAKASNAPSSFGLINPTHTPGIGSTSRSSTRDFSGTTARDRRGSDSKGCCLCPGSRSCMRAYRTLMARPWPVFTEGRSRIARVPGKMSTRIMALRRVSPAGRTYNAMSRSSGTWFIHPLGERMGSVPRSDYAIWFLGGLRSQHH